MYRRCGRLIFRPALDNWQRANVLPSMCWHDSSKAAMENMLEPTERSWGNPANGWQADTIRLEGSSWPGPILGLTRSLITVAAAFAPGGAQASDFLRALVAPDAGIQRSRFVETARRVLCKANWRGTS